MNFLMVYRFDDIWLVGPFSTVDQACDWGAAASKELWLDDPRWAVVQLQDVFGLRIEQPEDLGNVRGAYDRAEPRA